MISLCYFLEYSNIGGYVVVSCLHGTPESLIGKLAADCSSAAGADTKKEAEGGDCDMPNHVGRSIRRDDRI